MKQLAIILLFSHALLYGQDHSWTLQTCIDSALINNSNVRIATIDISIADANLTASQLHLLPTINGGASHGYNWGQTIDPFTNSFAASQVRYNNFYLTSSITLFSGLQNYYGQKIDGIDQRIEVLTKKIAQRNIVIEVLSAYLQVKLNQEIVLLKNKHLTFSQEQLKKASLLEGLHYDTKRKRLESQAQISKDQYELVMAENDYKISLFLLQSLIGTQHDSLFELADSISFQLEIDFNETELNQLRSEKKQLESKQAKGRLSPTISLNGSIGSGYSENNTYLTPQGDFIPKPFSDQLNENFYQSLSATLTIPIFNGANFYTQISIQELEYNRLKIENEQRLVQQENTILQNEVEITNQMNALKAAKTSFISYKQLYEDAKIKYNSGTIDYYTYLQSKEAFYSAESELIQCEYRLRFAELIASIWSN